MSDGSDRSSGGRPRPRPFLHAIRRLDGELAMPMVERLRILSEIEGDLEALRARFLSDGLSTDEAGARALEALVPDASVLQELDRVHAPWYARVTSAVRQDRLKVLERLALVVLAAGVCSTQMAALVGAGLVRSPTPFLWAVFGVGGVLWATLLAQGFSFWIRRDPNPTMPGVQLLIALSAAVLFVAFFGALWDFYEFATVLETSPHLAAELAPAWLVRNCVLFASAVLFALPGSLAWLVMDHWRATLAQEHRKLLETDR